MRKRLLRKQFQKVYHPEATYIPMYEQGALSEKIILFLLAINIRMFPRETDVQRRLLNAFLRRFVSEIPERAKLQNLLESVTPFLEVGVTCQNARCISYIFKTFFATVSPKEHNEDLLIVFHAICSLLFRNPTFGSQVYAFLFRNAFEEMASWYEPQDAFVFMNLAIGNFFKKSLPNKVNFNYHLILPTFAFAIYHFTERYLGYIWDPTDMCESPEYIAEVGKLVQMLSSDSHR